MKKDQIPGLLIVLGFIGIIFSLGFMFGHANGYFAGMEFQEELYEESTCRSEYLYSTFDEVPVKCLKYFGMPPGKDQ